MRTLGVILFYGLATVAIFCLAITFFIMVIFGGLWLAQVTGSTDIGMFSAILFLVFCFGGFVGYMDRG